MNNLLSTAFAGSETDKKSGYPPYVPVAGCSGAMIYGFPYDTYYSWEVGEKKPTVEEIVKHIEKEEDKSPGKKFFLATVREADQSIAAKALEKAGYSRIGTFPSSHGGGQTLRLYCKGLIPNKEVFTKETVKAVRKLKTKIALHAATPKLARGVRRAVRAVGKIRH